MVALRHILGACLCIVSLCNLVLADELRYPGPIRDKRTLGFLLKSFADAIGYDVQKRPSVLPLTPPVQPAKMAPAAPAAPAPATPAAATPAAADANAMKPAVPVAGAPTAAAPAGAAPASGAPPVPTGSAAPSAAPASPSQAPTSGAASVTPPTAPPLLTETVQRRFNLNVNWNRNVQPQSGGAPTETATPAAQPDPAAAPASAPGPTAAAGNPGPSGPASGSAPSAPASGPGPSAPAGPAAGAGPSGPAAGAGPSGPAAGAGPSGPAAAAGPSGPAAGVGPSAQSPGPAPSAGMPVASLPGPVAACPPCNVAPGRYQNNFIYYPGNPEQQQVIYQNQPAKNLDFPAAIDIFWQNSPWRRNKVHYTQVVNPQHPQHVAPNGEHGYHIRRYEQDSNIQHQNLDSEPVREEETDNPSENNLENAPNEQENNRNEEEEEDSNYDTSKVSSRYENKPRGFLPAHAFHQNGFQAGYVQPVLPLAVHGVLQDKVLVAWPAPFEVAESENKPKKVPTDMQAQYTTQDEFKYIPESYGKYNFFTVPPPAKYNFDGPSDPNIEKELSKNAQISESKVANQYTTVHSFNH